MIIIDGVTIPTPTDYTVDIEEISKAERNANGLLIKERVALKRKISLSWAMLTKTEAETLLDAVSPNFISVTYPDAETNGNKTGTFYAGTKSTNGILYQSGKIQYWKNANINLVER